MSKAVVSGPRPVTPARIPRSPSCFVKIKRLKTPRCPFVNLPQQDAGGWGLGLTAGKMKDCVRIRPETVARIDFLEWTGAHHLRHGKSVALRADKDPRKVVREI